MQQQRPNAPTTSQFPHGMAQRPGAPQQPRPAAPQTQQPRPAAPQAAQPRSITPQTHRLVAQGAALRPPPRSAAGGEGTLGRPIKLSANHFAVIMKKPILYHYDVEVKPLPPKALFKYCFCHGLVLLIEC
jgi:eukaryotic translation initiation factor 2C